MPVKEWYTCPQLEKLVPSGQPINLKWLPRPGFLGFIPETPEQHFSKRYIFQGCAPFNRNDFAVIDPITKAETQYGYAEGRRAAGSAKRSK